MCWLLLLEDTHPHVHTHVHITNTAETISKCNTVELDYVLLIRFSYLKKHNLAKQGH